MTKINAFLAETPSDTTKIIQESKVTTDRFAYSTYLEMIAYIASKGYLTQTEIEALEDVFPKDYFTDGFIAKKAANQIITVNNMYLNMSNTNVLLGSGFTKDISSGFSAGSGSTKGSLDTGTFQDFSLYEVYIIAKTDETSDILTVFGGNTPTMPSGYTLSKKIGWIWVDRLNVISKIYNYDEIKNTSGLTVDNLPFNYFEGFEITEYTSDSIFIYEGSCKDDTNEVDITYRSSSGLVAKEFDALWSRGEGGILDTGSLADSTQYYIYVILNDTTGEVDFLMSLSATSPTMPTNFTYKKLIGFIYTLDYSVSTEHVIWSITDKWEDENFDVSSIAKPNSIVTDAPEYEDLFSTGIKVATFSGTTNQFIDGGVEYAHAGRDNAPFEWHCHVYPENAVEGDVVLFVDYQVVNVGDIVTTPTRVTHTFTTGGVTGKQAMIDIDWVIGESLVPGTQIWFRFGRLATDSADTYTSKIAVRTFGYHYIKDKKGSDLEASEL